MTMERLRSPCIPTTGASFADHRAVRATGDPINVEYRIVMPDGGDTVDCLARAAPVHGHRRAGSPDGRLHRRHRARRAEEALRASEARLAAGAELAGLAFYEVDFGDGVGLRRRPASRHLRYSPRTVHEASTPCEFWIGASAPRRPRLGAGRSASSCTTGELEQTLDRVSLPASRPRRAVDPARRPRRRARRHRTRDRHVRRPARHHRAQARRGGAARPEPAPDPGPRGGARAARARAARRRDAAARRAGDRRRPRRARRARTARRPRRCGRCARGSCASARTSTPWRTSCTRRCWRSSAWPRRSGRNANGAGASGGVELSLDLDPLPAAVGKDAALCLFRVAQEALNNVARHAGARAASVDAAADGRRPAPRRP